MRKLGIGVLLLVVAVTPLAAGSEFVETFDSGNEGGWTFGAPGESQPPTGGNPGAYLDSGLLDTFAPRLRTTATRGVFTGDFRSKGVSSIGLDLITFNAQTTGGRPLALMLIKDPGTPGNFADDTAAYFLGPNIPDVGDGWLSYDYAVPSEETDLPAGWLLLNMGDVGGTPNHTWDEVIQDVDQVQFHYGDPTFVFIFQQWNLGADNLRITSTGTVEVTITGTVEFNQIGDPPLGDINTGDPVTVTFLVDPESFVDSPSFPTRGYEIDKTSFTFMAGTTEIGLQDPFPGTETPYFVLRDNDPAVDGFFVSTDVNGPIGIPLDQTGIFDQFHLSYSVTYTGDTLSSLEILDAFGTYDFDGLTVFNFTVDDGPFQHLGMIFEEMILAEGGPGGGDGGGDGAVPSTSDWGIVTLALIMLVCAALWRRSGSTTSA